MKLVSVFLTIAFATLLVWAVSSRFSFQRIEESIRDALVEGRLEDARELMEKPHHLMSVVRSLPDSDEVSQRALEVQFEYFHGVEVNVWYPENLEAIKACVDRGAHVRHQHLLAAAEQGKMETVGYFLDLGVPVEHETNRDSALANVAYWGDVKLVERMLELGADLNPRSDRGMTPLLSAAWSSQVECVRLLLERGADVDAPYYISWREEDEPVWKVIEGRAALSSAAAEVWALVAAHREELAVAGGKKTAP